MQLCLRTIELMTVLYPTYLFLLKMYILIDDKRKNRKTKMKRNHILFQQSKLYICTYNLCMYMCGYNSTLLQDDIIL